MWPAGATCAIWEAVLAWSRCDGHELRLCPGQRTQWSRWGGRGPWEGSRSSHCSLRLLLHMRPKWCPCLGHLRGQMLGPQGGGGSVQLLSRCPPGRFWHQGHSARSGLTGHAPWVASIATFWPRCSISPNPERAGGPGPAGCREAASEPIAGPPRSRPPLPGAFAHAAPGPEPPLRGPRTLASSRWGTLFVPPRL